MFCTTFRHPLFTGSHNNPRRGRLGAVGVSSARHPIHCAPKVRYALLYNRNGTTTRGRGKSGCKRYFVAHVTPNSLHFAGGYSLVLSSMKSRWIAVPRRLTDVR